MKRFYLMKNVGKVKYLVNFHNGESKHKDGSDFFDIQTFKNKKSVSDFVTKLKQDGYVYGK